MADLEGSGREKRFSEDQRIIIRESLTAVIVMGVILTLVAWYCISTTIWLNPIPTH